jgi:hypothetical protein
MIESYHIVRIHRRDFDPSQRFESRCMCRYHDRGDSYGTGSSARYLIYQKPDDLLIVSLPVRSSRMLSQIPTDPVHSNRIEFRTAVKEL